MERVVLVDGDDRAVGTEEKLAAHRAGLLHRAFSIFVFRRSGELLLQRRSRAKYHSGGLWSNTCCGHPRPGEALAEAARRRLSEEMGFDCPLTGVSVVRYSAALDHDLVENEIDHVLTGTYDRDPAPDPDEAEEWRWVELPALRASLAARPERFTVWLRRILEGASLPGLPGPAGSPPPPPGAA
jgi:isopentenyl-diphosphate delta-isomerase